MEHLSRFSYFQNWTEATIKHCATIIRRKHYENEQIILSSDVGLKNYVYFITNGSAFVIEKLYSNSGHLHYIQICIFNELSCFNIGENMSGRIIVASGSTDCVLIPRFWLLKHNKDNIWNRIRIFLDFHIPNYQGALNNFKEETKWRCFKKELLQRYLEETRTETVPHDVPFSIRLKDN